MVYGFISPEWPLTLLSVGLIGRMMVNAAYFICLQYGSEIFPTVIRGQGVALCEIVGGFAIFLSPTVVYLVKSSPACSQISLYSYLPRPKSPPFYRCWYSGSAQLSELSPRFSCPRLLDRLYRKPWLTAQSSGGTTPDGIVSASRETNILSPSRRSSTWSRNSGDQVVQFSIKIFLLYRNHVCLK